MEQANKQLSPAAEKAKLRERDTRYSKKYYDSHKNDPAWRAHRNEVRRNKYTENKAAGWQVRMSMTLPEAPSAAAASVLDFTKDFATMVADKRGEFDSKMLRFAKNMVGKCNGNNKEMQESSQADDGDDVSLLSEGEVVEESKPPAKKHCVGEAEVPNPYAFDDNAADINETGPITRNTNWGGRGNQIHIPLTLGHREVTFTMNEHIVLSTCATKLLHELIEQCIPVEKKSSLGYVLKQFVPGDWPSDVWRDFDYLLNGRNMVQHKKWVVVLQNRRKYEEVMLRVFKRLCPNWELKHRNRTSDCLRDDIYDLRKENDCLRDENALLKVKLAALQCQCHKRRRDDYYGPDEYNYYGPDEYDRPSKRVRGVAFN